MWSIHKYIWLYSSSNCTTGSPCNSLVGQAHPSESCQVLTLTLWIPGQTLTAATSTASFVQNPSVLRQLVYGMFKLMHVSRESHTAHESYGHIEQAILNFLLKLCNHVESLKNYLIVESVIIKLQSQWWSPNLRRPFLRPCEFSKIFCNYFPTSSVMMFS